MKSRDTHPSVAVLDATTPAPSLARALDGPDASAAALALSDEDDDTGRQGHLPIAVSDGDFATPTQRTRKITRPRGLRTLEQPVITPPLEADGSGRGVSPPAPYGEGQDTVRDGVRDRVQDGVQDAGNDGRHAGSGGGLAAFVAPSAPPRPEASVVDEFLAAPPTPGPELQETPAPDVIESLSDGLGFRRDMNAIENPDSAHQLRESALAATTVVYAEPDSDAHPGVPAVEDPAVFDPLDPAGQDPDALPVDAGAAGGGSPPRESISGSFVSAEPDPDTVHNTTHDAGPSHDGVDALHAVHEISLDDSNPVIIEQTPAPGEAELSPLAQTLANMAESMHGHTSLEPGGDLDIGDGPLVPLPAAPASAPSLGTPAQAQAPRATPPPLPTAALTSLADGAVVSAVPPAVPAAGSAGPPATRVPVAPLALPLPVVALPEALVERPRRPKRSKPWFEEVFDESYLRTLPFMTAEQTLQEVDFIESSLAVPRGSEILDVACGYGRHAIELVQRGLSVTGVDLSLPLLIRAADESQRRSVAVNFVHTDMREMSFERQFAGAYCMLTSFGYFDEESNLKVAEGIARALKPGGRFLIDVINRDYIVGDLPARVWWEGDGCVVLEEVDFNFNTNRVLTHRSVVFEDGQQLEQEISVRVYSLHELGKLLRQAGFRVLEVSGSIPTRGYFFGAHSRNLLILAERRAE